MLGGHSIIFLWFDPFSDPSWYLLNALENWSLFSLSWKTLKHIMTNGNPGGLFLLFLLLFVFAAAKCYCESEAWEAHLLCAREGMIEAGYIGHNGLLIWPQRTHDVYTSPSRTERGWQRTVNRERERDRVKPKLPKAKWSLLPAGCESKGSWQELAGERVAPSLGPHLQVQEEDECPLKERWGTLEPRLGHKHTHQLVNHAHWVCVRVNSLKAVYSNWSRSFI